MDEIEGMPAVTTEGLRIKAECILCALESVQSLSALRMIWPAMFLAQVAGRGAQTSLANPDAELIRYAIAWSRWKRGTTASTSPSRMTTKRSASPDC